MAKHPTVRTKATKETETIVRKKLVTTKSLTMGEDDVMQACREWAQKHHPDVGVDDLTPVHFHIGNVGRYAEDGEYELESVELVVSREEELKSETVTRS